MKKSILVLFYIFILYIVCTGCSSKEKILYDPSSPSPSTDQEDRSIQITDSSDPAYEVSENSSLLSSSEPLPEDEDPIESAEHTLSYHLGEPYLFADDTHLIHPTDPISKGDVVTALSIMFDAPQIPDEETSSDPIDRDTLIALMSDLKGVDQDRFLSIIDHYPEDTIRKSDFAILIYSLTSIKEPILVADDPDIPLDLDLEAPYADAMITALLPYTLSEEGTTPHDALLSCRWKAGDHYICGYLYRTDADGYLLRGTLDGSHLYFNENGRYTSGSDELDTLTSYHLHKIVLDNPEADAYELLEKAYYFCSNNIFYYAESNAEYGDNCNDEWVIPRAIQGLDQFSGNCYSYGAAFCALARSIGYDAHCISGKARNFGPHCWCVIYFPEEDGTVDYKFFDPQMRHHSFNGTFTTYGFSMFAVPSEYESLFVYVWESPEQTCIHPE